MWNKVKFIALTLLILSILGCKTTNNRSSNNNIELIEILENESNRINELKLKIASLVNDKYDKQTPYKVLVKDKEALKIKMRITEIYNQNEKIKNDLVSLKSIIESCENQEINWAEYCFKEMPWLGVEPILNVWIKSIEESIIKLE